MQAFDRITTTIERECLAEIIAGTKKIEYRQIKPYWAKRFEKVSVPFELRLLKQRNVAFTVRSLWGTLRNEFWASPRSTSS
jgi:hypothetical protein